MAELERLAAIAHADFDHEVRITTTKLTEFRHTTTSRPKLAVTVTIAPCNAKLRGGRPCLAMEPAAWQPVLGELKQGLGPELRDRPDTRFELGVHQVAGAPAIYTYQLGWHFGQDHRGQPTGTYIDAYMLFYNDGVNELRIRAAYVDDALASLEQLAAIAPKDDLEKLASAFLSFYVREWKS